MKKALSVSTLLAVMVLLIAQPVLAAGRGVNRQFNQDKRICQGINSGELTGGEARHLQRQQHRIQKHKRIAWADGTITRKERNRLERQQDKAIDNIYRLKHNRRCKNKKRAVVSS
jgi:hypothetical protein